MIIICILTEKDIYLFCNRLKCAFPRLSGDTGFMGKRSHNLCFYGAYPDSVFHMDAWPVAVRRRKQNRGGKSFSYSPLLCCPAHRDAAHGVSGGYTGAGRRSDNALRQLCNAYFRAADRHDACGYRA